MAPRRDEEEMATKKKKSCLEDYEKAAAASIPAVMWDYFRGGADEERTLRECREVFKRYRFKPRVMRDVSKLDPSTTILGLRVPFPFGFSPVAFHKAAHPMGEIATARVAEHHGIVMAISNCASIRVSEIAEAAPNARLWMQIYIFSNRALTEKMVRAAEVAGCRAIVVTVDRPVPGKRRSDKRNDLLSWVKENRNTARHFAYLANMAYVDEDLQKALSSGDEFLWAYSLSQLNSSVTWSSIRWLKSTTDLPVVVKGILSGDMAREAVAAGADAILVSAHGARQLDGVITPLDALPEVVEAVRDTNTEVYLDGGIRTGMDAFRAIALGARAVFIGRPQLWGLASGGQQGVEEILDIIKDEFSRTMALTGCASISDIQSSLLVSESQLKSKL